MCEGFQIFLQHVNDCCGEFMRIENVWYVSLECRGSKRFYRVPSKLVQEVEAHMSQRAQGNE